MNLNQITLPVRDMGSAAQFYKMLVYVVRANGSTIGLSVFLSGALALSIARVLVLSGNPCGILVFPGLARLHAICFGPSLRELLGNG